MAKTLIVVSRVKELARIEGKPLNVASDLCAELTRKTEKAIEEACKRAVANGRTTVMPRDL